MGSYNKLVRDKIIEIISQNNEKPLWEVLSDEDYLRELKKKIVEEATEVENAESRQQVIEELADLFEVVSSLMKQEKIDIQEIENVRKTKREKRGGFDKKIYLKGVEE